MNNKAKTYHQFITEAYIDDSGEVHGLEMFSNDEETDQILDNALRIREYLEHEGANNVQLDLEEDDRVLHFTFDFEGDQYDAYMDLYLSTCTLTITLGSEVTEIFKGTIDEFYDLLSSKGLDFLTGYED
jgi:hypothetical protein